MREGVSYCIQGKFEKGFWQGLDGIGPDFGAFTLKASGSLALSGEAGAV